MAENKEPIWQDSCLSDAMAHVLKSGHLTDINIHVGSDDKHRETFKCHKFLLAAATPIFEKMFYGDFIERNQNDIKITDIEPEEFKLFLEYIYAGKSITNYENYSVENFKNFIYIGNKYLRPKFADFGHEGLDRAVKALRYVDVIELFDFACNRGYNKLITSVSQELGRRTYTTISFNPALLSLELETFKEFIKCINVENIRFNWIEEYVRQNKLFEENPVVQLNQVTKKRKSGDILSINQCEPENQEKPNWKILLDTISYEKMTIEQFRDGPAKSNLLTPYEKFNISIKRSQALENRNCQKCGRPWH